MKQAFECLVVGAITAAVVWTVLAVGGCDPLPKVAPIVDRDGYILTWDEVMDQAPGPDYTPVFKPRYIRSGRVLEYQGTWQQGIR